MNKLLKTFTAGIMGVAALGMTAALAQSKSDQRRGERDNRSQQTQNHDKFKDEQIVRGSFDTRTRSGATVSITFGNANNGKSTRYKDNVYYDNGYRANRRRIVNRKVIPTRFKAQVVVKEEIVRKGRRRANLVCTVTPRGPEADYVPYKRLKRIAKNHCSYKSRVKIFA